MLDAIAYALDAAVAAESIDDQERAVRLLNLSALLIGEVGPEETVDVLDANRAITHFLDAVPVSADEARSLAANWRGLEIERIRALRAAKNLATPALAISRAASDGAVDPRLRAWDEIVASLP